MLEKPLSPKPSGNISATLEKPKFNILNLEKSLAQLNDLYSKKAPALSNKEGECMYASEASLIKIVKSLETEPGDFRSAAGTVWDQNNEQIEGAGEDDNKRYFTVPVEKCDFCRADGHLSAKCPKSWVYSCSLCMVTSSRKECRCYSCASCGRIGHSESECAYNGLKESSGVFGERCERCGKFSHQASDCQALLQNQASPEEDIELVHCLRCGQQGHINCNTLEIDDLYKFTQEIKEREYFIEAPWWEYD